MIHAVVFVTMRLVTSELLQHTDIIDHLSPWCNDVTKTVISTTPYPM